MKDTKDAGVRSWSQRQWPEFGCGQNQSRPMQGGESDGYKTGALTLFF